MGLDSVDAIYLTGATISTVGYGDINPSLCVDGEGNDISDSTNCVGLRVFTCLYILFGCGYVFAQLANVFGGVLIAFSDLIKRLLDKLDTTPAGVDTSGDGNTDTQVAGRSVGISGKARDLTGDGNVDFIEPPTALVYWMQEMVPALLLLMLVQVVSAIIFAQLLPDVNFATALYHCFITATTVGYGDVKTHHAIGETLRVRAHRSLGLVAGGTAGHRRKPARTAQKAAPASQDNHRPAQARADHGA